MSYEYAPEPQDEQTEIEGMAAEIVPASHESEVSSSDNRLWGQRRPPVWHGLIPTGASNKMPHPAGGAARIEQVSCQ